MLAEELSKLSHYHLRNMVNVWGMPVRANCTKPTLISKIMHYYMDDYYLKGVLENLTPLQVTILCVILESKTVLTLGEISRSIRVQPINVEKELSVLKHFLLIYQKKNRARITSNLDKYPPYDEVKNRILTDKNIKGNKLRITIEKMVSTKDIDTFSKEYLHLLGKNISKDNLVTQATSTSFLEKVLTKLSNEEAILIDEIFQNGGILEINHARLILEENKLNQEVAIRRLDNLQIVKDLYFVEHRFIRMLIMPVEFFEYLKENPLVIREVGITAMEEKILSNEFDFIINLKKLLLFISNKGFTLTQSQSIKQVDLKKTEEHMIDIDVSLFRKKSHIYQVEIALPILKLFNLVSLKTDHLILENNFEEFIKEDILVLLQDILAKIKETENKYTKGEGFFLPTSLSFYDQATFHECIEMIGTTGHISTKTIIAQMIREKVVLSPTFSIQEFRTSYMAEYKRLVSALLYMQLFGIITVYYPERTIELSEIGKYLFFQEPLTMESTKGCLYVNPDGSILAMKDEMSLFDIAILKAFCVLQEKSYVYNFILNRDSVQQGILLGYSIDKLHTLLVEKSKTKLPQNLSFWVEDWTKELPIIVIEEGVVLLETSNPQLKQLLVGQLRNSRIVLKDISPTTMIIDKTKIKDVMLLAEKFDMIVKLIR